MIGLGCLSPLELTRKSFIKNSIKQSIYFHENHRKSKETGKSNDQKLNPFVPLGKFNMSIPKQNKNCKTFLSIQPVNSFVRSKTEISINQKPQKIKAPKISPPNHLNLTDNERLKRKKKDPTLRLIAKTLMFRKSHKYYLYSKNKTNSQQLSPQKSNLLQITPKRQALCFQRQQSAKKQRNKQNKKQKYKLLQMQGNKINIQQFLAMQTFTNSNIYLKSNSQSYYV